MTHPDLLFVYQTNSFFGIVNEALFLMSEHPAFCYKVLIVNKKGLKVTIK